MHCSEKRIVHAPIEKSINQHLSDFCWTVRRSRVTYFGLVIILCAHQEKPDSIHNVRPDSRQIDRQTHEQSWALGFSGKAHWAPSESRGPLWVARGHLNWSLIFVRVSYTKIKILGEFPFSHQKNITKNLNLELEAGPFFGKEDGTYPFYPLRITNKQIIPPPLHLIGGSFILNETINNFNGFHQYTIKYDRPSLQGAIILYIFISQKWIMFQRG